MLQELQLSTIKNEDKLHCGNIILRQIEQLTGIECEIYTDLHRFANWSYGSAIIIPKKQFEVLELNEEEKKALIPQNDNLKKKPEENMVICKIKNRETSEVTLVSSVHLSFPRMDKEEYTIEDILEPIISLVNKKNYSFVVAGDSNAKDIGKYTPSNSSYKMYTQNNSMVAAVPTADPKTNYSEYIEKSVDFIAFN